MVMDRVFIIIMKISLFVFEVKKIVEKYLVIRRFCFELKNRKKKKRLLLLLFNSSFLIIFMLGFLSCFYIRFFIS